jgi:DNA-binding transcriptional LysR family regulator
LSFRGSLQDIRLFVAAYEEKSFSAAATRENSTQSGVSHHMRQLEQLLNVKLFVREAAGVVATPAADLFYGRCIDALRTIDDANKRMSQFVSAHEGHVTVGIIPALTRRITAPTMMRLARQHPNIKVRIIETVGSLLPQMINSGEVDCAIGLMPRDVTGVRSRPLLSVPECLITRATAGLSGSLISQPPDRPIKLVLPSQMSDRRATILAGLAAHGISIESELQSDSPLTTLDLVRRSDWVTIVPTLSIDAVADVEQYAIYPLLNPAVQFSVMLLERTASVLTPEAESFLQAFTAEAQSVADAWMQRFSGAAAT